MLRLLVRWSTRTGRQPPSAPGCQREARTFRRRFRTEGTQGEQGPGSQPDFDAKEFVELLPKVLTLLPYYGVGPPLIGIGATVS